MVDQILFYPLDFNTDTSFQHVYSGRMDPTRTSTGDHYFQLLCVSRL